MKKNITFPILILLCFTLIGCTTKVQNPSENPSSKLIEVSHPKSHTKVTSPIIVVGKARGPWFFEATFPIQLLDESGNIITQSYGQTKDNWMTEDFVSFQATIPFETTSKKGTLLLQKNNPSDLREHDDHIEIPVEFLSM